MSDIEPMDEAMRALLRRGAPAPEVPAGAMERVLAGVARAVVTGTDGGGDGGGEGGEDAGGPIDGAASGSPAANVSTSAGPAGVGTGAAGAGAGVGVTGLAPAAAQVVTLSKAIGVAAVTFLLGGGAGAVLVRSTTEPRAVEPRVVYVERPSRSEVQREAPSTAESPPTLRAEDLPDALALPALPALSAEIVAGPGSLVAERRMLDEARLAFGRGEAKACLELIERHERSHPRGALSEERDALRIRALSALGVTSELRARVAKFRARYPESLLGPAVEAALDGGN